MGLKPDKDNRIEGPSEKEQQIIDAADEAVQAIAAQFESCETAVFSIAEKFTKELSSLAPSEVGGNETCSGAEADSA